MDRSNAPVMAKSRFRSLASLLPIALLGAMAGSPAACPTDGRWDRAADFGWTCHYRTDNNKLIASRSDISVVFMGDSITEGWAIGDPAFFANGRVDRGISGQTTPQMVIRFAPDVLALKPRMVHIMGGTNDIAGNTGPMTIAQTEANIRRMAEMAHAQRIKVVIASILPARAFGWKKEVRPAAAIAELNQWLRDYAKRRGFVYADYYSAMAESDGGLPTRYSRDGVHPNKAGYALMRPIADAAILAADTPLRR
jgi:lysophospholipase L1-like esterase